MTFIAYALLWLCYAIWTVLHRIKFGALNTRVTLADDMVVVWPNVDNLVVFYVYFKATERFAEGAKRAFCGDHFQHPQCRVDGVKAA